MIVMARAQLDFSQEMSHADVYVDGIVCRHKGFAIFVAYV